jgi:hypothetical protein
LTYNSSFLHKFFGRGKYALENELALRESLPRIFMGFEARSFFGGFCNRSGTSAIENLSLMSNKKLVN